MFYESRRNRFLQSLNGYIQSAASLVTLGCIHLLPTLFYWPHARPAELEEFTEHKIHI